jgi:hypothetical protein
MSDLKSGDLILFNSHGKRTIWVIIEFDNDGFGFWALNEKKRYFSAWDLVSIKKLS